MIDDEIFDDGFERRHVGPHNAFLLRTSRRARDMAAAARLRQDDERDARFEASVIATKLVDAIAAIARRPNATLLPFRRGPRPAETPAASPLAAGDPITPFRRRDAASAPQGDVAAHPGTEAPAARSSAVGAPFPVVRE